MENLKPTRSFLFWALTPFLLFFVLAMPVFARPNNATGIAILVGVELTGGLMLLGLYDPMRFWWTWRGVGGMVFVAYVCYVVAMLVDRKWQIPARKAESTLLNAIIGLVTFGVPGLWWALYGRFPQAFQSVNAYDEEFTESDDRDQV